MESLAVGAILLDPDRVVTHVNELAAIILGIERHDLVGRLLTGCDSKHPHYLQICDSLNRISAYPDGEQQAEINLHVRGREHNYVLRQTPVRATDGRRLGALIVFHDVTHLRDKERARNNLVATLSHELKTPLTALSLAVELLKRNTDDQKNQGIVDSILDEVSRIRDLTDGLLSAARGETASIAVRSVNFDLGRMASSVMRKFTLAAAQKEVRLKTHVEPDLQCYGDPVKLSFVLSNLIGNALRWTPDGGQIEVCMRKEPNHLRLSVSDTGAGIPAEIGDVIFERSAQWEPESSESGSTGLGLAIAKEIVEAHGGRIFAESSAQGSVFTVDLPLA